MHINLQRLAAVAVAAILLAACTRDRPTPEVVTTGGEENVAVATVSQANEGVPVAEPEVATVPPNPVADAPTATSTPDSQDAVQSSSAPSTFQYTVVSGDTVFSIADKYGTDTETIRQLNFLVDDNIRVGQILRVPLLEGYTTTGRPTPTPSPYIYIVQPGDTLYGLSNRFNVSAPELISANSLLDSNDIVIGQELIIPGRTGGTAANNTESTVVNAAEGVAQVVHVVQPGEGLNAIAELYGILPSEIAQANNIQNRELLRVGQRLFIPGITLQQAAAADQRIHIMQPGQGLLQIAVQYGISAAEIADLNNIQDTDLIYPGQELIIPGD